jgi:hypothetical protein
VGLVQIILRPSLGDTTSEPDLPAWWSRGPFHATLTTLFLGYVNGFKGSQTGTDRYTDSDFDVGGTADQQ